VPHQLHRELLQPAAPQSSALSPPLPPRPPRPGLFPSETVHEPPEPSCPPLPHAHTLTAIRTLPAASQVRVFVESVLRYGLTNSYNKGMVPNFKSFLLVPKKGKSENLRKALAGLYTSAAALLGEGEEETVVPGATGEFYPYVYVPIETEPQVAT
jgi:hypothetical protein